MACLADNSHDLIAEVEVLQPSQPIRVMAVYLVRLSPQSGYLFVLRFYGPVNPMGSCRAGQFT